MVSSKEECPTFARREAEVWELGIWAHFIVFAMWIFAFGHNTLYF